MPKYLVQASYTVEGAQGLLKEGGTKRRAAVEAAINNLGGTLGAFYYAFGQHDAYLIVDLPDNASAAAVALAVNASGGAHLTTTVLMTPEEVDSAVKKQVQYRAPGH